MQSVTGLFSSAVMRPAGDAARSYRHTIAVMKVQPLPLAPNWRGAEKGYFLHSCDVTEEDD